MDPWRSLSWRAALIRGIAAACITCALPVPAATPGVAVQSRTCVPHVRAFARVQPIADASVRAGMDGRLAHLDVVPGNHVHAGQRIGALGGRQVKARLKSDRARFEAARREERARRDALGAQRYRLSQHLSSRENVDSAEEALARAQARRVAAGQTLDADRALAVLRAPASGTVIAVHVHVGERVGNGQVLLRIQPDDGLWLMASAYDPRTRQRLHVGMRGQFTPDDGSATIAVRIVQLPPRLHADGGQPIAMQRTDAKGAGAWIAGETGTVVLEGKPEKRLLVPTRALVLDRGRWWVLLVTAHGEKQQPVTPGERVGARTVIERGLRPGDSVVVEHVYRRFHSGIAQHYQIQD